VENVQDYLRAADLFILPSHFEGMPNALLEAMACGLPVVATSVSGVMDLIKHGQNGLLVEPGRADRLADAIVRLLEDREMALLMGIEARKTMEQFYSIKAVTSAYAELYTQLLSERDRHSGPAKTP
jgi:glycosyltransferase involved in cell wall biosynthesis